MKMLSYCIFFVSLFLLSCSTEKKEKDINRSGLKVGSFYSDALTGTTFISGDTSLYQFRFGWFDSEGNYQNNYKVLEKNDLKFGASSPDLTYNHVAWTVQDARLEFEWGKVKNDVVVGCVKSDSEVEIIVEASPLWDKFNTAYTVSDGMISGKAENGANPSWYFKPFNLLLLVANDI